MYKFKWYYGAGENSLFSTNATPCSLLGPAYIRVFTQTFTVPLSSFNQYRTWKQIQSKCINVIGVMLLTGLTSNSSFGICLANVCLKMHVASQATVNQG